MILQRLCTFEPESVAHPLRFPLPPQRHDLLLLSLQHGVLHPLLRLQRLDLAKYEGEISGGIGRGVAEEKKAVMNALHEAVMKGRR